MPLFKYVKTHCKTESYLNTFTDWNNVIIIAQLRNNLSRLCKSNLRELSFSYNQCTDNLCENCHDCEIENGFHLMFSCNRYRIITNVFLKNYTLPTNLKEYLKFFVNMDKEKIKDVCDYVKCMLKIRNKL
jgi:hypothetical protein